MKMKRYTLALAALAVLLAGCGQKKTEEVTSAEEIAPKVSVVDAVRQKVPHDAVYSSTVQANVINNIAPQSAGRIMKINVEIGDFVSAGQILAEMERVQLEQAYLRLQNEEKELGRLRQLLSEGGISQSDFESYELSCNVSRSAYRNLEDNTVLRSPVSGVVTARNYDCGDMYAMAQPLFTVQQITPVKILVGVSESDYTRVRKGDNVSIEADALPGKVYTGRIVRLYPTMDATTHTFNIEVQVGNANRELRPGMYVRAKVTFDLNESVVIPDAAIVKQQGSGVRFVYILQGDGTVRMSDVTLGRHFDGKYEILSGLEGSEKVVVKGQTALKNGVKVEVI